MKNGWMGIFLLLTACPELQSEPVTVDAGKDLGDASQIRDFLGAGGGLDAFSDQPNHPVVQAWRRLGMKYVNFEDISPEDECCRRLVLSRDPQGQLQIDFRHWDRRIQEFRENLKSTPIFSLGDIPRLLSSQPGRDNYSGFMPLDLGEWRRFCTEIARHNVQLGLSGSIYHAAGGEPDYIGRWVYAPGDDPASQLANSVRLYAASYLGVKAADPTAKVGGPGTMNWRKTKWTETAVFALDDWLGELARYNRSVPESERVSLDFINWQDYAWAGDSIHENARNVADLLAKNGFDPNTPKSLAGGAGWGTWSSDYLDGELKPHQRASHFLTNLIEEFDDPRERRFQIASYYFFFSDEDWYPDDPQEMDVMRRTAPVQILVGDGLSFTPLYAAFQIVSEMAEGRILETRAPATIKALAVRKNDGRLEIVLNQHAATGAVTVLAVKGAPFGNRAKYRIQQLDETHSHQGQGLESGQERIVEGKDGELRLPVALPPYGSMKISLYQ